MAPLTALLKRTSASAGVPTAQYVGFGVAGLGGVVVLLWMAVHMCRKRARRKREDARESAFLTVRGIVKESPLGMKQTGFSRSNLTASIVMPDKAIIRPDVTPDDVLNYYSQQGKVPRPFAPFSFALNAAHAPAPDKRVSTLSFSASAARLPPPRRTPARASVLSSIRDSIRDSFFGGAHARALSAASSARSSFLSGAAAGGGGTRAVRQAFTPILPDEPALAPGERVAVLRAFDDGWCVVARAAPYGAPGEAELGAVPAWCFVKPMKGLRSERPVRSSSLGVTVQADEDRPRDDIISWSNF